MTSIKVAVTVSNLMEDADCLVSREEHLVESASPEVPDYDPLYVNAKREAIFIFLLWFVCLLWCVPYCYLNGYVADGEEVALMWGMPQWIVYGILGPWILADIVTVLFCVFIFSEDDLGPVAGEAESAEAVK